MLTLTGELLQTGLELLVVCSCGSVDDLLLPPSGSLATNADLGLELLQLLLVHFELCNHLELY